MNKKANDFRIKVFGIGWWLYMTLAAAGAVAVFMLGQRMDNSTDKFHFILVLSIIELIILRLYKYSLRNIRDDYNYYNELPCYLCNQSTLMCIIGAITHDTGIMAYCTSIGTLGALLALIMPDRYNRDQLFFSMQAYGFYGYHCLLIITCLSFRLMGLYHPVPADVLYAMLYTLLLVFIAHIINIILVKTRLNPISNYVFTLYPDNSILQKLWDMFPRQFWYLLPLLPVLGLASLLMFVIL